MNAARQALTKAVNRAIANGAPVFVNQPDLSPKERAAEPVAFPTPAHEAAHPLAGRYDELIAVASRYVPPDVTVDMCRHPSVIMPTFWLFRDGSQIAAVTCEGAEWRASRMRAGQPYAQQRIISLEDAIRFAVVP